jgi:hypothetical protein
MAQDLQFSFGSRGEPAVRGRNHLGAQVEDEMMSHAKRTTPLLRAFAMLAVGTLLTALTMAAAKADKGGSTRRTGSETCWVTPNPVANGSQFTIAGQGFTSGMTLDIFVGEGGIVFAQVLGDGTFSCVHRATFLATGAKQIKVYRMDDRHLNVLATCSFTVD